MMISKKINYLLVFCLLTLTQCSILNNTQFSNKDLQSVEVFRYDEIIPYKTFNKKNQLKKIVRILNNNRRITLLKVRVTMRIKLNYEKDTIQILVTDQYMKKNKGWRKMYTNLQYYVEEN